MAGIDEGNEGFSGKLNFCFNKISINKNALFEVNFLEIFHFI